MQKRTRINRFSWMCVEHTYDNPKPLPTINSTTYEWEQSVVEGHATHPVSFMFLFFFSNFGIVTSI